MAVRRHVHDVVPLVVRGRHRVVHFGGRVPERCVDEPSLPFTRPDGPSKPGPGIVRLAVPFEMADVTGFEVDRIAVVRTQDRDARVWTLEHLDSLPRTRSVRRRSASITRQVMACDS